MNVTVTLKVYEVAGDATAAIALAVAHEREACAALAQVMQDQESMVEQDIPAAIRARGQEVSQP